MEFFHFMYCYYSCQSGLFAKEYLEKNFFFSELFARSKGCISFQPNTAVVWTVLFQPRFTEAVLEQNYLAVPHITTH